MDVLLRGIAKETYRRLKAEAALRGERISEALHEAIEVWLHSREKQVMTEWEANNRAYLRAKRSLLKKHKGKYAAFGAGSLLGVSNSFDESCKLVRRAGVTRSIITKVGEEAVEGGEWLWSSLELVAA